MTTPFGRPQLRKEDQRFITGRGRYVDDLRAPGALHAAFVRSPHAHARVDRIDAAAARAMPGVAAVYTLADLPECRRPIPPSVPVPDGFHRPIHQVFAEPTVRHVGEVVAVVLATEPYLAADAAEAVVVDYTPEPAAASLAAATAAGAPRVFKDWPGNDGGLSSARVGEPERALAGAHVMVEADLALARVAGAPIEPRGLLVMPEGPDGRFTVWIPTQSPYGLRATLAAALDLPEEGVRVICTDSGGGFGIKGHAYSEDLILAAAARRLGRPLKWTESRREHFLIGSPDRGQRHHARLGVDREGRIVAVETRFARDHGADMPLGEVVTRNTINHLPGPYRVPHFGRRRQNVVTHTLRARSLSRLGPAGGGVRDGAAARSRRPRVSASIPPRSGGGTCRGPRTCPIAPASSIATGRPSPTIPPTIPPPSSGCSRPSATRSGGSAASSGGAARGPIGVGLACYVQGTGVGPFEGATCAWTPPAASPSISASPHRARRTRPPWRRSPRPSSAWSPIA